MLQNLLQRPNHPDACVVAVCAHEFAHILQFRRGIRRTPPTLLQFETHADYLSGWFAGIRKIRNPEYPAVVFAALARDVGTPITHAGPDTHGTPEQRGRAVEQGFLAAVRDKLSLDQAIQEGSRHVQGWAGAADTLAIILERN